ncbi:hypothetical protein CYFUS_007571 [Cystobacter fuscus]|uniref:Uncharacterized protein n=1 Tax=Cystobacter fuscus TaxID=43 RepID=A0A250JDV4_9BACT|nr:hypothetical protein [Cystobacter fuscus]ATB42094.1 hypothetical protein CYFUS_007571 [Cystobacter fuscus]
MPEGWPDYSTWWDEELLAPFLSCTSPAEFVALQDRVDMPRLVEALSDWNAVRLGSLGPVREDAAGLVNLKRIDFLLRATERYGPPRATVFALFVLHSAHDDDLREMLFLLARDKQLEEMLRQLPTFRAGLEDRGLRPSARADRAFEWKDVGRGLARAGRDALATSQLVGGVREATLFTLKGQLPLPYQQALDEVETALAREHFAPGNVALGSFDHLTFGVPLGFYGLVAGTGHGTYALYQGQYEQATRELAPTALLVGLYAGGKGLRAFSEGRGVPGVGVPRLREPMGLEVRLRALKAVVRELEVQLGVEGLRKLVSYVRASREAGRLVAVEGVDGALALYAAGGDATQARPLLSQARAERGRAPLASNKARAGNAAGSIASLVDKQVGLTPEVVEAKLAAAELESPGQRLPADPAMLEKHKPLVDAPQSGAEGNPRWGEYVSYFEKRLVEIKRGHTRKGPLPWKAYEQLRTWFARGLAFERIMVDLLEADAALPRTQRRFLGDFNTPRIDKYVGVSKPGIGLSFADVLIIEAGELGGRPPRVETLSFKSRDLSRLDGKALEAQMIVDAREALSKYGETLDIRRPSLQPLLGEGSKVPVSRVRLVYEGDVLKPRDLRELRSAVNATRKEVPGVEVLFQ